MPPSPTIVPHHKKDFFLIGINGPMRKDWAEKLKAAGIEVVERVHGRRFLVRAKGKTSAEIMFEFVVAAEPYPIENTIADIAESAESDVASAAYEILLFDHNELFDTLKLLKSLSIDCRETDGRKIRICIEKNAESSNLLKRIANLPQVQSINRFFEPETHF